MQPFQKIAFKYIAATLIALFVIQAINYVLFKLGAMNLHNIFGSPTALGLFAGNLYCAAGEASGQMPMRGFWLGRARSK
ncbi:MAG: hypothetical protein JSR34_07040 [Proteobacteria bacterium]|nr:hypothetical protein [Pseudomonadota bacterium]